MSKEVSPNPEQQPLPKPLIVPKQPYTPEEAALLPYSFRADVWQRYYYAFFFKDTVYAKQPNSTEWHFEANNESVTKYSWNCHYSNFLDIEIKYVFGQICETYQGKKVVWSNTTKCWQYLNHKVIDFTTADKKQVPPFSNQS